MSIQGRGKANDDRDDNSAEEGGASFAWEFTNDDHHGQPQTSAPRLRGDVKPRTPDRSAAQRQPTIDGEANHYSSNPRVTAHERAAGKGNPAKAQDLRYFGPARSNYVRDQLDRALDRWWAVGELPPLLLLRDSLLMLEAGGTASESQRTLLLRAALSYNRGIQTALHHQADGERVALVLAEALVEWESPLEPASLPGLIGGDEYVRSLLVAELERSRVLLTGEARRRAQAALDSLPRTPQPRRKPTPSPGPVAVPVAAPVAQHPPIRQIILILLLVALVGFVLWQRRTTTPTGMVAMPAASYAMLAADEASAPVGVALNAFYIDRFEVTNRDYRTCIDAGKCVWPLHTNSTTRRDYFTNPAFDGYPVVNVTQIMASAYCVWQGKRLPTAGEWQAAASVSPVSGQPYRFPWGESFEVQRTNSAGAEIGDTVVVGSYRPAGDSPSGAADMAGNVAEWTATLVPSSEQEPRAVIKGGSFASVADALAVGAEDSEKVGEGTTEVGFRCARDGALAEASDGVAILLGNVNRNGTLPYQ
jgi:formylglycine-generating enzyme required for sulfatase activity